MVKLISKLERWTRDYQLNFQFWGPNHNSAIISKDGKFVIEFKEYKTPKELIEKVIGYLESIDSLPTRDTVMVPVRIFHDCERAQLIKIQKEGNFNNFGGLDLDENFQQVLKSHAGFYIGTLTPASNGSKEFIPNSRDSQEYWKSRKGAETAFYNNDWTQRLNA